MRHFLRCKGCGKFVSERDIYFGNAKKLMILDHDYEPPKRRQIIECLPCFAKKVKDDSTQALA